MGTPKPKRQNQPEQALSTGKRKHSISSVTSTSDDNTGKRKHSISSVTSTSDDNTGKLAEPESNRTSPKQKQKKKKKSESAAADVVIQQPTKLQQLSYFLHEYQSANRVQLSSLEIDSFKEAYNQDIYHQTAKNASDLGEYLKSAFGSSWKEMLCGKEAKEGEIEHGNPAVIVVALSALRCLELLRELKPLTKECPAVKLFSKHMKVEEQVGLLKKHVNIACGTPNRIKKLIDMEALGLSRLTLVVLDMYRDVKGYSLLTLPQVREEFWHLYKGSFHEKFLGSHLRVCLYGSIPAVPAIAVDPADN